MVSSQPERVVHAIMRTSFFAGLVLAPTLTHCLLTTERSLGIRLDDGVGNISDHLLLNRGVGAADGCETVIQYFHSSIMRNFL